MRVFDIQLVLGTLVIIASVIFHVAALVGLARFLRRIDPRLPFPGSMFHTMLVLGLAMLVIIGIHTIEAWGWAAIYLRLGEFEEFEDALYFSVVTATTLGYGDITLSDSWRILATFEAMGGLILFGGSTAFLLGLMRRIFGGNSDADGSA